MKIKDGDFNDLKVLELLRLHLSGMQENSPPKSVHALDLTGLQSTDISFWTVWSGDDLMGCGALKRLSADRAEIKSMRTHAHHMRKGVGAYLLEYIIPQISLRRQRRACRPGGLLRAAYISLRRHFGKRHKRRPNDDFRLS